jgi:hypothetical protein
MGVLKHSTLYIPVSIPYHEVAIRSYGCSNIFSKPCLEHLVALMGENKGAAWQKTE